MSDTEDIELERLLRHALNEHYSKDFLTKPLPENLKSIFNSRTSYASEPRRMKKPEI